MNLILPCIESLHQTRGGTSHQARSPAHRGDVDGRRRHRCMCCRRSSGIGRSRRPRGISTPITDTSPKRPGKPISSSRTPSEEGQPPRRNPPVTTSRPTLRPFHRGRNTVALAFWCTSWSPFGAPHGRRRPTEVDQPANEREERMREADQPVTMSGNDEVPVKIAFHQDFCRADRI